LGWKSGFLVQEASGGALCASGGLRVSTLNNPINFLWCGLSGVALRRSRFNACGAEILALGRMAADVANEGEREGPTDFS